MVSASEASASAASSAAVRCSVAATTGKSRSSAMGKPCVQTAIARVAAIGRNRNTANVAAPLEGWRAALRAISR